MTRQRPALLTGASGRLGRELASLLPQLGLQPLLTPSRAQLDVTVADQVFEYVTTHAPGLIVHTAAFTDVVAAESQRQLAWNVNVEGTRNVAAAARSVAASLLHISTDYVFNGCLATAGTPAPESGSNGRYREEDPPGPVLNYYALTKLVAEEAARSCPASLVLRTSFRAREWPYERAFDDMFTSQDYVDVIAPLVAEVACRFARGEVPLSTLHVGTERKSVYELAQRRAAQVARASRLAAGVTLPADVSLDLSRWRALRAAWAEST